MTTQELSRQEVELIEAFRTMDDELQNSTSELVTNAAYGWRKYAEEVAEEE